MSGNVANGPDNGLLRRFETAPPLRRNSVAMLTGATACLVAVLTLSGAFDSDELGIIARVLLWCAICGPLVAQVWAFDSLLARVAPAGPIGRAIRAGGALACTVALMTLVIAGLKRTPLAPRAWGHDALLDLGLFVAPTILVIGGFVLFLRGAASRNPGRYRSMETRVRERPVIAARPVIAGLLPPPRSPGGELPDWPADASVLWVRAHDHYLEVATPASILFIRARMRDAIAKLRCADGMQVHRSWWVAKSAVQEVRRAGRDHILVLKDGVEVPIGRGRMKGLHGCGWL